MLLHSAQLRQQEVNTRGNVSQGVNAHLQAYLQICVGSGCHESPIHPPIYPSIHPPTHLSTHSSSHQVIYSPHPFIHQSLLYDGQSFSRARAVVCQCALMIHVLEPPLLWDCVCVCVCVCVCLCRVEEQRKEFGSDRGCSSGMSWLIRPQVREIYRGGKKTGGG